MRYKNILLYSVFAVLFLQLITNHLHAQSHTIETILITRQTELVPGTNLKVLLISGDNLSINNNGDFIFDAHLSDTSQGIILFSDGKIKLRVKAENERSRKPGDFLGVGTPDINDNGTVVFCATTLLDEQKFVSELFKIEDDIVEPIVRSGDFVIGLESTDISIKINFS